MFKQTATISIAIVLIVAASWTVSVAGQKGYFQPGALDPSSARSDSFRNHWYSKHLNAMSEPVLGPSPSSRTYRFTWLRTFHHPVAVRITSTEDHCTLFATELDGAGGYGPGKILRKKQISLGLEQCEKIQQLIETNNFWNLPSSENTLGLDGSEWIVEGATTQYHVVTRWTPESGPIHTIGKNFLSLADWQYKPDEMY
jgi:hypothetical protein